LGAFFAALACGGPQKTGLSAPIPRPLRGRGIPLLSLARLKNGIPAVFELGVFASQKLQGMETAGIPAGGSSMRRTPAISETFVRHTPQAVFAILCLKPELNKVVQKLQYSEQQLLNIEKNRPAEG
jgi:hypothetical protein